MGCPSQVNLNEFIESGEPGGDVQRHVSQCAACREVVAELRENAAFLALFRSVGVTGVPPTADLPVLPGVPGVPGLSPESDPVANPDLIDGYRVLGEIHRGGQGVVYRAVQVPTQRTVAIKMLLAGGRATGRDKERFEREARIAAGLRHPNIVTVYDGGYLPDGRYAFAMEYIKGEPLDHWSGQFNSARTREARRRALRERLRVMAKVCDAVLCAHQHAIVHRDLKPANIMVDSAGEPHVLDFGIARDMGPEARTRLTHPGGFACTLAYASPEQVSGDPSRVDTRTDIYSLGVILYEMVSGRMPYAVEGPVAQAIRNVEKAEPAPLLGRTADPDGPFVDGEVATIILKAMAKDPARRYQTAAGLGKDIDRYLAGEAIEARRDSTWYVLRKAAARHRLALSGAVLVFLLLAAFGAAMAWQAHRVQTRGRALAVALSAGNIDRGRARVELGNIAEAQALLWSELIDAPPGVEPWNPGDSRLPLSRAWWALWELYAAHPCAATIRTTELGGPAYISTLLPVPGHDDLVLIAGGAGTIELRTLSELSLKARTTNPIDPHLGRPATIFSGAFTPDGVLATVSEDHTIRRWDATTLEPLGAPFPLNSLAPAGDQPFLTRINGTRVAIPDRTAIRTFDLGSGSLLETTDFTPGDNVPRFELSLNGEWLALTDAVSISAHRIGASEAVIRVPRGPDGYVWALAFAGTEDVGTPRLFFNEGTKVFVLGPEHPEEARPFAELEHVSNSAVRLALSGDDRWLAIAGEDRRISVWDARGTPGVLALPYIAAHDSPVTALAFTPNDDSLLSGHNDGVVQRWDLSDLTSSHRGAFTLLRGHQDSVFALAVGTTAGQVRGYSSAYDRTVRAWDLESGQEIACSSPLDAQIESIALSADGRTIAAAIDLGDNADVVLLDAATLRIQNVIKTAHKLRCADLAFSPDGGSLATVGQDGFVRVWGIPTMQEKAQHKLRHPGGDDRRPFHGNTMQFSPDGRTLGWGGARGIVSLADPSLSVAPRPLLGNSQTIRCLRFSPDGRRVAAAGNDSTIWIWDTTTGRPVHELKGHVGITYAVAFSPDGRMLASGGGDGTIRLWDAATGDNLAILRDKPVGSEKGLVIFAVQFTPDGDHLFVGGDKGYLGIWDLRHFDRHIAGNLEYQLDQLSDDVRGSSMAAAARRWAELH